MSKYSEEFKLKLVLEYIENHISPEQQKRKYGISPSLVRQWIAQYQSAGKFTEPTRHFSGEFKLKVLNYQQEHHLSDLQTALIFGITNSFRSANSFDFWNNKSRNNLCVAKEVYYRW